MTPYESDDYLLADLIDLPVAEREAFLFRTCGHDTVMRERLVGKLEQLMDSISTADGAQKSTPARGSLSEIAHALASGLEVLEKPGTTIGRYTLLQKIGEGGCGIVYLAEQQQPVRREVALKLIKLGLDTREFVARFEAERQALALMEHPNIARVFDAGATEVGRPYFVMELVRGIPITNYCDENSLPVRDRLQLFVSVCQAVQHAHQKGVIHRDLKPSNILVAPHDGIPIPKIIDFGIAKALDTNPAGKTQFTQFHSFIGTPAYTSPEQVAMSGLDVDTRSDIYSLGVLLYELLTGRTPFDSQELAGVSLEAMRKTIRETESPRPSTRLGATEQGALEEIAMRRGIEPPRLFHLIRGDLDWIAMKCLEKDRTRRYETASGLAADLIRHLNDEPVVACPPSSVYRFRKVVRRYKLAFIAGFAVAAALLLGTIASTWQAVRATQAKREALAAKAGETAARTRAQAQELVARQQAYASDMNVAMQALRVNNLGHAQDLLYRQHPQPDQSDLRGWEWRYLWQQTRSDALSVVCEKTKIESLTVSSDGRWLAIGVVHKDGIFVWDLETRQEVAHLAEGKNHSRAVFSPTEPLLAFATDGELENEPEEGDKRLYLWNATTRQLVAEYPLEGGCPGLAFSRDGQTLVTSTAYPKGHLTLWRLSDGVRLASFPSDQRSGLFASTGFATDPGLSIAAYGSQERVRVVDLRNGNELWSAVASQQIITALAFSPDGTMLATAAGYSESDIRLWDVATGGQIGRLEGHTSWVGSLVFWPDGRRLASSSADQTIRTWDVATRTCTDTLRGHRFEVWRLALLPDNRTLVSGGKDGVVCLWDTSIAHPRREHASWSDKIVAWCFAPDSRSVLTLDSEGQVARWSGHDFQEKGASVLTLDLEGQIARWSGHPAILEKKALLEKKNGELDVALFSADGRFVACAFPDGNISIWDVSRRTLSCTFKPAGKDLIPMLFLADGKRLVVWSENDNRLLEWDLAANREVQSWPASRGRPFMRSWGLSPDEQELFVLGFSGNISLRNLAEESTTNPNLDVLEVTGVAFTPSGKLLAMSSLQAHVRVWNTGSWQEVATLRGYLHSVSSVAFSPDGHRLATSASAGAEALKLWAVDSWQDVLTLPAEGFVFTGATFSPDGNAVGVISKQGGLHVWRAPSREEIEKAEAGDHRTTIP